MQEGGPKGLQGEYDGLEIYSVFYLRNIERATTKKFGKPHD